MINTIQKQTREQIDLKKKRKSEGAITYLYNSQRGQWLEQMLQET